MSEIELKKSLFGGYTIGYDCPHCKSRLKSSLNDAGKTDVCPDCKRQFVVPGTVEQEKLRIQAEHEEIERLQKAQEEREAAKERKAKMEQAAATFSPGKSSQKTDDGFATLLESVPNSGNSDFGAPPVDMQPDTLPTNSELLVEAKLQSKHLGTMADESKRQTKYLRNISTCASLVGAIIVIAIVGYIIMAMQPH